VDNPLALLQREKRIVVIQLPMKTQGNQTWSNGQNDQTSNLQEHEGDNNPVHDVHCTPFRSCAIKTVDKR
jgi:hypothetical protein